MGHIIRLMTAALILLASGTLKSQTIATGSFHKVIVSPFIEATFIADPEQRVVVNQSSVDANKLHVENKNGTLRVYLDGAKELPRDPQRKNADRDIDYPKGAVSLTIYYKTLEAVSLRGQEQCRFPGTFSADNFSLKLYGECDVRFAEVRINDLHTIIYGESKLVIESGSVNKQSYTCYGEGYVNTTAITSAEAKLKAYGEANFQMNVTDRIRISSFGEAKLRYKGNPVIEKPINIGGVDIAKLE